MFTCPRSVSKNARFAQSITFVGICFRADPEACSVVRGPSPLSAPQNGQANQQEDPPLDAADVLREEEDASRVLVQHSEEQSG